MEEINKKEEDFGFYGSENDENNVKDIEGITDKVTEFTFTKLAYPCIVLKEGFNCAKHQLKVISNMVKAAGEDKDINLYFIDKGTTYKMGKLSGMQMSSFLDIVGTDNIIGFYDDGTRLEKDRIYVLCSF